MFAGRDQQGEVGGVRQEVATPPQSVRLSVRPPENYGHEEGGMRGGEEGRREEGRREEVKGRKKKINAQRLN